MMHCYFIVKAVNESVLPILIQCYLADSAAYSCHSEPLNSSYNHQIIILNNLCTVWR